MARDRARLGTDEATLSRLWHDHDPQFDIELDRLAAMVAADESGDSGESGESDAMRLLLTMVHVLALARPAISKVLVDPAAVDDAMQRTLISVEKGISSFDGRSKFRTWLHTVARNEALMVIRAKSRTASRTVDMDIDDHFANAPESNAGARLSSMIATQETIRHAIDALHEPYRSTMRLRVDKQLGYQEIADQLEVPIGTIRSRLARAQDMLSARLFSSG